MSVKLKFVRVGQVKFKIFLLMFLIIIVPHEKNYILLKWKHFPELCGEVIFADNILQRYWIKTPLKFFISWHCCLHREDHKVLGMPSSIRPYPTDQQWLISHDWPSSDPLIGSGWHAVTQESVAHHRCNLGNSNFDTKILNDLIIFPGRML